MRRILLGVLMTSLVSTAGVGGQEISRVDAATSKVEAPVVARGEIWRTAAYDATRLKPFPTGLAVQSQQGRQRSWAARHPVLTGLLAGAAAGAAIGAASCGESGEIAFFPGECPVIGAGVGAGLGAGVGALISFLVR